MKFNHNLNKNGKFKTKPLNKKKNLNSQLDNC